MRLNWSPYPVLSNARPVTCRYKSGLVSTEQVLGWSTTWRTGCKIWRTLRIYSQSLFSARVCWTRHLAFCALVGDVYVIFEIWRKFSAFPLIPQQSIFPSEASQDFLCSGHLRPWMWKSKYVVIFVWFFFFFLLLVPASLSGVFALSAWNSSGHREAAGLSFVSSNHSYWFGVWSNYGGFVLGRGKAGCMDGSPACGCQGRAVLWGVCALWPLHSWLFTPGESPSLEHWFTENVVFFWVQVDDSSCWSQQSSRQVLIFVGFPPTPILQGEFCQILSGVNGAI